MLNVLYCRRDADRYNLRSEASGTVHHPILESRRADAAAAGLDILSLDRVSHDVMHKGKVYVPN